MPKLYLATIATYRVMSESLTKYNYKTRLLSYYLLRDYPDEALTHYVDTGISLRKPKQRKRHWHKNRVSYLRERRIALAERLKRYEQMEQANES
jgi:hypothetical protein